MLFYMQGMSYTKVLSRSPWLCAGYSVYIYVIDILPREYFHLAVFSHSAVAAVCVRKGEKEGHILYL